MDERFDTSGGCGLRNDAGTNILHSVHIIEAAHKIDDRIRVHHCARHAIWLSHISRHQLNLTDIAERFDMIGATDVAAGHTNTCTFVQQRLRHIAAQKTAAAKNRYQLASHKCSIMQRVNWLALCTTTRKLSRPTCARLQIIGSPCALSLASYSLHGNGY